MLPETETPDQEDTEDEEEYYRAYSGNDAEYYLRKLEQYRAGTKITFNVAAFFFGIFWMLYRRMYKQGLVVMVALTVEAYLINLAIQQYNLTPSNAKVLNNVSSLIWSTLVGFFGNWLYLRQAKAKVEKALEEEGNESGVITRLTTEGNITLIPHIIIAALVLLLLLFYQGGLLK